MKTAKYRIKGLSPLLMHNERLANPFDDITRAMKGITGKRKKTDDDLLEIARLEWLGGLYYTEANGIHVPGYNLLAAIIGGGKVHKLGTAVKRSAIVESDELPVIYEGSAKPDDLFADKRFVDMRSVKVGTSKVMRCRPKFNEWQIDFALLFDEAGINRSDLDRCVETAGQMVGLGDYRPRFGRFEIAEAK